MSYFQRSNIGVNNPAQGQFPLPGSQQIAGSATGNPRNKVALAKGFSLMDWIRLSKSGKDLTGVTCALEVCFYDSINNGHLAPF